MIKNKELDNNGQTYKILSFQKNYHLQNLCCCVIIFNEDDEFDIGIF